MAFGIREGPIVNPGRWVLRIREGLILYRVMDTWDKLRLNRKRGVRKATYGKAHFVDTQESKGSTVKLRVVSNSEGLKRAQSQAIWK